MNNPFLTITCPDKDGFIKGDIYDLSLSKMQGFMRPSVRRKGDIADNLRQISRLTSHRDISNTGVSESDHKSQLQLEPICRPVTSHVALCLTISESGSKLHDSPPPVELSTNLRKDFTITEKGTTGVASRHFACLSLMIVALVS